MAFAIMGGLLVATVLTLIFLPALYVTWFRLGNLPGSCTSKLWTISRLALRDENAPSRPYTLAPPI